jgi:peptidoglycan/LPS O-acetylase OafA/YrhL
LNYDVPKPSLPHTAFSRHDDFLMHRPLVYRPEIDGLRAFAVISVLIYHLNHEWLPGGYLGVDVFFVISGFLITSIIMKDCAAGEFSYREFYLRRARRILPAMLVVTAVTCVVAYFILFPVELRAAAKACKRALLCYSNYHFAKESGYFDPGAVNNPFLHTWSLGVEEQFYFVFPLLAVTAFRCGWLKARHVGIFVVLGFAVSCFLTRFYPTRAFFVLESRAWELAAGAWLAVAASRGTTMRWLGHKIVAPISFLLLLVSVVLLESGAFTPAPMALCAVLGAVLFMGSRAGGEGSPGHRFFSSAPLRFMGRISYSLYLVHWPLIVFTRSWFGELTPGLVACVVMASLLLSIALHHAIEQPLRQRRNPVVFLSGIAGVTSVLLWCAMLGMEKKGNVNPAMQEILSSVLPDSQILSPSVLNADSPYRIGRTDLEPTMALWGDSHAMALVAALDDQLKQRGICCEVWVQPGNVPGKGVAVRGQEKEINDDAITALSRPHIRDIIILSRWSSYLKGKPEDHNNSPRIIGAHNPAEALPLMAAGLDRAFALLRSPGRQIALVYPVPETGIHVPYLMARKLRTGKSVMDLSLQKPAAEYASRHDLTLALFDDMSARYGLLPVRPDKLLIHDGALKISQGNRPLYVDDDHLSRLGSEVLIDKILGTLSR